MKMRGLSSTSGGVLKKVRVSGKTCDVQPIISAVQQGKEMQLDSIDLEYAFRKASALQEICLALLNSSVYPRSKEMAMHKWLLHIALLQVKAL
jgi:hypothetical protein